VGQPHARRLLGGLLQHLRQYPGVPIGVGESGEPDHAANPGP
jgi:hypothetical protein